MQYWFQIKKNPSQYKLHLKKVMMLFFICSLSYLNLNFTLLNYRQNILGFVVILVHLLYNTGRPSPEVILYGLWAKFDSTALWFLVWETYFCSDRTPWKQRQTVQWRQLGNQEHTLMQRDQSAKLRSQVRDWLLLSFSKRRKHYVSIRKHQNWVLIHCLYNNVIAWSLSDSTNITFVFKTQRQSRHPEEKHKKAGEKK